jgi:hypothetical protein
MFERMLENTIKKLFPLILIYISMFAGYKEQLPNGLPPTIRNPAEIVLEIFNFHVRQQSK